MLIFLDLTHGTPSATGSAQSGELDKRSCTVRSKRVRPKMMTVMAIMGLLPILWSTTAPVPTS